MRHFIHFQVATLPMADAIVRNRHRLKLVEGSMRTVNGTSTALTAAMLPEHALTIVDVLSPEESATHAALFPRFLEAV